MRTDIPRRPAWNHIEVKTKAAEEIVDAVQDWAAKRSVADGEAKEFKALVTLAMRECPDSYAAARYLEDMYQWPVDKKLVDILDGAYRRTKFIVKEFVHDWVMKYKVRFPAKVGDGVVARIGDREFKARVVEVLKREARAVAVPIKGDKNIIVYAEEVQRTFKLSSAPDQFPTGPGTPGVQQVPVIKKTGTDG